MAKRSHDALLGVSTIASHSVTKLYRRVVGIKMKEEFELHCALTHDGVCNDVVISTHGLKH